MSRFVVVTAFAMASVGCLGPGPSAEVLESFEVPGRPVSSDEPAPLFASVN